jgi:hypothetical protein
MQETQHLFVQVPMADGVEQRARSVGATQWTRASFQAPWLHVPGVAVERAKRWIRWALRWSARAALLSPILIVLRLGPREVGDAGIVIVVALAVVFFSLLSLFVFLSLLAYRARKRIHQAPAFRLPFSPDGRDVLRLADGGAAPGAVVRPGSLLRVSGTLLAGTKTTRGGAVVEDFWWPDHLRLTQAVDLLLDRGDQPPVVLELDAAPVIIAPPQTKSSSDMSLDSAALEMLPGSRVPDGPCDYVSISDGDEVVLVGTVERVGPLDERFASVASPRGGPYRGGPTGITIKSTCDFPACLVLTRARFS